MDENNARYHNQKKNHLTDRQRNGVKTAMRIETHYVKTTKEATDAMPWAAIIVEVEGGFKGFESVDDFDVWNNQE